MNGEILIVFVILLLGLILCSFLGGKTSTEGMTNESPAVYYGPNGSSAQIETASNGENTLVVTTVYGATTTYTSNEIENSYTGPNGDVANIISGNYDNTSLIIINLDGSISTYNLIDETNDATIDETNDATIDETIDATNEHTHEQYNSNHNHDNYDNYNHYTGSSVPTIFYSSNGGTAKIIQTANNNMIIITNKNGTTKIYYNTDNSGSNTSSYYGHNGGTAQIITDKHGAKSVEITSPTGGKIVYNTSNEHIYISQDETVNQYDADNNTTGTDIHATTYHGPHGGQYNTISGPSGNTYSTYDSSAYYNSFPEGVSRSQIPDGEEDLYILKSQIVPPVCPKCPQPIVQSTNNNNGSVSNSSGNNNSGNNSSGNNSSGNNSSGNNNSWSNSSGSSSSSSGNYDKTKCPPCPPCARCPEPAFDCKKVPNYKSFNQNYMPVPVLSDFSTFGM